jgi:PKD repeat protein
MDRNSAVLSIIVVLVIIVALLGIFLYWDDLFPAEESKKTEQQLEDNEVPIAKMSVDRTTVHVNDVVRFNGNDSSDPDGEIDLYIWNFGDGTPPTQSPNASFIEHQYAFGGDYTVNFTVQDDDNARNSTYENIHVIPRDYIDESVMFLNARQDALHNDSVSFPVEEEVTRVNISISFYGLSFENGLDSAEFEIYIYNPYSVLMDSEEVAAMGNEEVTFEFDKKDLGLDGDYTLEITCNSGSGYIPYTIEVLYDE